MLSDAPPTPPPAALPTPPTPAFDADAEADTASSAASDTRHHSPVVVPDSEPEPAFAPTPAPSAPPCAACGSGVEAMAAAYRGVASGVDWPVALTLLCVACGVTLAWRDATARSAGVLGMCAALAAGTLWSPVVVGRAAWRAFAGRG